jgi:hypothetical protein
MKCVCFTEKHKGYEDFIQSEHGDCQGTDCLTMIPAQLCTHLHSDHNYYAICSSLLDPTMDDGAMRGGLFHTFSFPVSEVVNELLFD